MIQRIQSLYLLLGAFSLGVLLFFSDIWQSRAAATYVWFEPVVMVLIVAAGVAGFVAVFLYTARRRQRTVVVGAQMLTVLLVIALYGGLFLSGELNVRTRAGVDVTLLIALLLPMVGYVFYYLARRGIEKDIRLIEDIDRFRLRD